MAPDLDRFRTLLRRWEDHWRAVDAPIASRLRPGASRAHLEEVTAPLGINLPAEVKALFGWHDGLDRPAHTTNEYCPTGPRFPLLRLEQAATLTLEHRAFAEELNEFNSGDEELESAFPLWKPSYFAVFGAMDLGTVYVDTSGSVDNDAFVGYIDNEGLKPPRPEHSLTDLVAFWVQCLDSGTYTWDQQKSRWRSPMLLPPFARDWGSYYN